MKKLVKKKSIKMKGEAKAGALYAVTAIGVIGLFGALMAGGLTPTLNHLTEPPPQGPLYTCCDSGDGAACHPLTTSLVTYNGDAYGLLKSNIVQSETMHVIPTNSYTPDGHRIFINTSETTADHSSIPGCEHGKDLIALDDPSRPDIPCFGLPNDELIYVCKDTVANCNQQINQDQTPFDVYFRIKDGTVPPEISTYCPKPKNIAPNGGASSAQEIIGIPTPGGRKNLQLEWFQVQQHKQLYRWLGAWCKPAINLYPTQNNTSIQVAVAPKGDFTLTIPSYPQDGWKVTASPDGTIKYGGISYPYLFWEAAIPDSLINEPKTGYVVEYKGLSDLFNTILPQMGLNEREQAQFTEYWLKALPQSPYYFVGVVPQNEINALAPLSISPAPDSLLRVTLLFKALDKNATVTAPELSGFTRKGFTVTEWGGFFKADKNHQGFTCLM